jgi:hypothetical protein
MTYIEKDEGITKRINEVKGDMSLGQFAKGMGMNTSTVHNYIKGRMPPISFVKRLYLHHNVNPIWLIFGAGNGKKKNDSIYQ